uniref:C2 domain-containing protein n=1 Tax=Photinus pyralis TaxID=7054 RepID=A0A1Y1MYU1_PHOPY
MRRRSISRLCLSRSRDLNRRYKVGFRVVVCWCLCRRELASLGPVRFLIISVACLVLVHSSSQAWISLTLIAGQDIRTKSFLKNTKKKGKLHTDNIYCKVTVNDQEHLTDVATDNVINGNVIQNGVVPASLLVWNYSMQFLIKNINEEVLSIVVLEMCPFQPDEFLGRAELKVLDIYHEAQNTNGPIEKKLILHQVESGELTIKLDLHMFTNDY